MKNVHLLLAFLFSTTFSSAQLIPYNKAGSWGVVTEKREPVIPFQYKSIEMRGDFILARNEGSSDVYNRQGQKISNIPGEYVYPALLKGRQAAIMPLKDGVEVRYLDGEVGVPVGTYDYIRAVQGGFEVMKNGKYGIVDQHLNVVLPPEYKEIQHYEGWIVPFNGNTTKTILSARTLKPVPCDFTLHRMDFWERGYFVTNTIGLQGLVDTLCNTVVPNKYKYIYVGDHIIHAQKLNDQHDLYNKKGKLLLKQEALEFNISPQYYFISVKGITYFYSKGLKRLRETRFDEVKRTELPNLLLAREGKKWGVIDTTAKLIYPLKKDGYYPIYENYAAVGRNRGFYSERFFRHNKRPEQIRDTVSLIYRNGRTRSFQFSGRALGIPVANRQAVVRDGKIGFVNFKGEDVIPFVFDYDETYEMMHYGAVRTFNFDPETRQALVLQNGQNVFIDTTGAILKDARPVLRSYHKPFGNGYKLVYAGEPINQVGIVNAKDEFVVPLTSEPIQFLSDRFLVFTKNQKKALFDLNLKQITDYKYDMIHDPRYSGLLMFSRDGKTGYMNEKGEEFFE